MDNIFYYDQMVNLLRKFARKKGFLEVPAQSRLSILAACEEPRTIVPFSFDNTFYPLPQTGQMWLEIELLKNPHLKGLYCITTSYRNEPEIIENRHKKIFPMFEFEAKGTLEDLRNFEQELLEFLGFEAPVSISYEEACQKYNVDILEADHEEELQKDLGDSISLEYFPRRTSPFWNMKHGGDGIYHKIDVLLHGMETIGSAERSTNVDEMRHDFLTISNGAYCKALFDAFGKDRVMKELDEYLSLPMFPRFGGGIGLTRLARALELSGLFEDLAVLETV
ncbi:MAG: transposase [Planctomycetota bacterium]|nr:MAG: transposase [Planctomycetota bacterium]